MGSRKIVVDLLMWRNFFVVHSLNCPNGGYAYIRKNEILDSLPVPLLMTAIDWISILMAHSIHDPAERSLI